MITLQTTPATPNAVYAPQFVLQMGIMNGKLVTSCQITLAAAKVVNAGTPQEQWEPTGQTQMIYIGDLDNPDPDLLFLAIKIGVLKEKLTDLIERINQTRKVL